MIESRPDDGKDARKPPPAVTSLKPNFVIVACGSSVAALLSFAFLPWQLATASTILTILMIAGADVDARTCLLPDVVTYGAVICGVLAAALLDPVNAWAGTGEAVLRAAVTSLPLAALRAAYTRVRGREGLGLGDVKLAAAVGAWLPLEAVPICFSLAATAALVSLVLRRRKERLDGLRVPFGAFLCPALWLVFFVNALQNS
jgi:leader peptidase (prepilin peptidase) / N-methyltransferase